jgi:hypothetical protein
MTGTTMFDYHWKRMRELNKNEKQYLYAVIKSSLVWFGFMEPPLPHFMTFTLNLTQFLSPLML